MSEQPENVLEWPYNIMNDPVIGQDVTFDFNHPNEYELIPYLVQDGKKHKTAIICPGGGYWMVCSYVEGTPFAEALNRMGISAVIVYYRVREKAHYPAPQDDLARAVREVHARAEEWNLDMEGYSVWGSSAGGHLAGSFGTDNMGYLHYGLPKPGALVLIYPVITMTDLTHAGSRENLLGEHPTEEMIRFASIEQQATKDYPPTFLWCGDIDSTVPPENSKMLERALNAQGVHCKFMLFPGIEHGAGLGTGSCCEPWFENAVKFWMEQIS